MTENLVRPKPGELMWWGYQHTDTTVHLKRYFEPLDIQEARESPFCATVVGPFRARDWKDANDELFKLLGIPR